MAGTGCLGLDSSAALASLMQRVDASRRRNASRRKEDAGRRTDPRILKSLIEVCRDEEQTLRFVADHLQQTELKDLFLDLADQRLRFAVELAPHVQRLGGADVGGNTARGAVHRRWLAVKEALVV